MMGRVLTGVLTDEFGWRAALTGLASLDVLATLGFWLLLPVPRRAATRARFSLAGNLRAWGRHLRNRALRLLFFEGFAIMGVFVTVYNYIGYRLGAAPYDLSQGVLGAIFLVYAFGMMASTLAGFSVKRLGRTGGLVVGLGAQFCGVALTLSAPLGLIILGIVALTVGFFLAHTVASGWVGVLAATDKGHASSLYLLAYYIGSSVAGSVGGWVYHLGGWGALVAFVLSISALGLGAAFRLGRITTLPEI
jgi:YNFM family putative membrane transporter